jgi:transmembrane sensor
MLAVASCVMLLVIGSVIWLQYRGMISTAVGEQRHVVLEDGTRVFLNTDTRIVVKFEERARRVELRRGEALFNVAKRSAWPFIVVAGDRQVRALGTSFVVRKDVQQLEVTLVEGSVLVAPATVRGDSGEFKLTPGQRLTFGNHASPRLDTPSVERITAWRRGQVILEDTPLQAAVAEMNRYNETKLVVPQPEIAALPINGLFQAGDSSQFANAVAQAYGLTVIERGNEIVLSGEPAQ